MILCENLMKIYKTEDIEVVALQGLDLTVDDGELIAVIGTSGSGKSTLLNMIGGLDKPSAGKLIVDGKDLLRFSEKDYITYKRDTVGFVWQNNARNLIPYLSAEQNVQIPMLLKGGKPDTDYARYLLAEVGLEKRMNSKLSQMSGGEQQRVAIAIALANHPKLLLADEPTGAVDSVTSAHILDIFNRVNREMGVTVVIVTHDMSLSKRVNRVVAIRDGRTSSEFIRKIPTGVNLSLNESEPESEQEELAVVDGAGRVQIPKEYLRKIGINGKAKLKVEQESDGRITILPPEKEEEDTMGKA